MSALPAIVLEALRPRSLRLASPDAARGVAELRFDPKPADWRLLEALQEVIADGRRPSNAALATRLGVSREAVRKRLARSPGLRAWMNAKLEAAVLEAWPLVLYRAHCLAMQGSIRHMCFLADVHGWATSKARNGGAA